MQPAEALARAQAPVVLAGEASEEGREVVVSSPVDDDGDVLGRLVLAGNCSSLALECQAEVPILPACELNQPATQR